MIDHKIFALQIAVLILLSVCGVTPSLTVREAYGSPEPVYSPESVTIPVLYVERNYGDVWRDIGVEWDQGIVIGEGGLADAFYFTFSPYGTDFTVTDLTLMIILAGFQSPEMYPPPDDSVDVKLNLNGEIGADLTITVVTHYVLSDPITGSVMPKTGRELQLFSRDAPAFYSAVFDGINSLYVEVVEDEDSIFESVELYVINLYISYTFTEPVAVGGIVAPVDKFALLAPYIVLAIAVVAVTIGAVYARKRWFRRAVVQTP